MLIRRKVGGLAKDLLLPSTRLFSTAPETLGWKKKLYGPTYIFIRIDKLKNKQIYSLDQLYYYHLFQIEIIIFNLNSL